jgi:CDP-paratose 2-epimerase
VRPDKRRSPSKGRAGSKIIHIDPRARSVGIAEHFRVGERERVGRVLADMAALGLRDLRVGVSWADYMTAEGKRFYDWMLPTLAARVRVVPCIAHTPPSLGVEPRSSAPPRSARMLSDWLDVFLTQHGDAFEHVELWNAPNSMRGWDSRLDPDMVAFAACVGGAAGWARERGKKTVLGGLRPADPNFLRKLADLGVLSLFDAIGIHAQPDRSEPEWTDWKRPVAEVRAALSELGVHAQVWITEGGFSTWRHDEGRQARELLDALESGADRLYWHAMHDLPEHATGPSGFHHDPREYAFGLVRADGTPKLLYRLWSEGGLDNVRAHELFVRPTPPRRSKRPTTLVTGGAGFIGSNVANALLSRGEDVILLDNLSRPGIERNVRWLREHHGDRMRLELADVRDPWTMRDVVRRADRVFHFAAQVAVTTSLVAPRHDFAVNAGGTLNLLEALRELDEPPPLVFTSTNKVYGALPDVPLRKNGTRYEPSDPHVRAHGVGESRPLDFHSPYGCSKGVADQYILDYARCFDLPAAVFRMSCIYGPRQFGNEEQGWVAHFVAKALRREPITIYGDGLQVRDVLSVGDLVDAFLLTVERMYEVRGNAFNVGGGPENTVSLIELLDRIGKMIGRRPEVRFGAWRPGDQRYYCSDYRKLQKATGWRPSTAVDDGLAKLREWLAPAPEIARASGGEGDA